LTHNAAVSDNTAADAAAAAAAADDDDDDDDNCIRDVLQEAESNLEMERSAAQEAHETSTVLERKLIAVQTELDDVRALLEAVSISSCLSSSAFFLHQCSDKSVSVWLQDWDQAKI